MNILFEGILINQESYDSIISLIVNYANKKNWQYAYIVNEMKVIEGSDLDDIPSYIGPTRGIVLYPHHLCDWLYFEFDGNLHIISTINSVYAPPEIHISIIELLCLLELNFKEFSVIDTTRYYDRRDKNILIRKLSEHRQIKEDLREGQGGYGPSRGKNGKISDF